MDNQRWMQEVRFDAERSDALSILKEAEFANLLKRVDTTPSSSAARKSLLGHAVHVDGRILPQLEQVIDDVRSRTGVDENMDCFVYQSPMLEASVLKANKRFLVLLSSSALEKLSPPELEFVIGHELGHVAYEHYRIPVQRLLDSPDGPTPRQAIHLLSWHRKAEISADRAGLLCCGSLEIAASAFFKVISGLTMPHLKINPLQLEKQFDSLREVIWQEGSEEMWQMTHPLAPLRVKSLAVFWRSERARKIFKTGTGGTATSSSDREIADLLAYMEPLETHDKTGVSPMLLPLLTWGGLYVAASNRVIERSELSALADIIGKEHLTRALQETKSKTHYSDRFRQSLAERVHPLSALDIDRFFTCLITIVRADGSVDASEKDALSDLARQLNVSGTYVESLLEGA